MVDVRPGQQFVLTEEDSLLVISCAYGTDQFSSLQEATAAAKTGTWQVAIKHVPNRAPGAAVGQTLIGHEDVTSSELAGYQLWRTAFARARPASSDFEAVRTRGSDTSVVVVSSAGTMIAGAWAFGVVSTEPHQSLAGVTSGKRK